MSQSGTVSPTALVTNLHLKKVLKAYVANAMNSLSGPGCFQESWKQPIPASLDRRPPSVLSGGSSSLRSPQPVHKPSYGNHHEFAVTGQTPFPIQPAPIFSQPDQTSSEQSETLLEGVRISCFAVGGEKRLCLPQILNTILSDKELDDINTVCDDLRIYLPQCTALQLNRLKEAKVLPTTAPSCGLITLTDAERLCGALLHRKPDQEFHIANREKCRQLPVIHRCFGKVRGTCFVDLYGQADAPCIECAGCRGMFSPRHFVLHSDDQWKSMEPRLCHWGFDSNNWRHYIFIPEEIGQEAVEKSQPLLEELKRKFDGLTVVVAGGGVAGKRSKFGPADEQSPFVGKRIKIEEAVYPHGGQYGPVGWFIPPMGKNLGGNTTGLITTPDDLSSSYTHAYTTVNNLTIVSSADGRFNHATPAIISPTKIAFQSPFEKFSEKFQPNVALFSSASQQPPSSKCIDFSGPRLGLRIEESAVPVGNGLRERSSAPSTSHAPDRQRGSFRNDVVLTDVVKAAESEDDVSSDSTLSVDFGQESAFLEDDEDELNNILARTDGDTRIRMVREVNRLKQRYGEMLLQAQHDKLKVEKDLQYYKALHKDHKTEIQQLKSANAKLENENGQLLVKVSKRWSFSAMTSVPNVRPEATE